MTNDPSPTVSVIVPARNEEASLATCLHSLVEQTGIDYEIIVIDDDSTDRTAEIAQSFAIAPGTPDAGASTANVTGSGTTETSTTGKIMTGMSTTGKGTTSSRAETGVKRSNGTAESRALPAPEDAQGADAAPRRSRSSTAHVAADVHILAAPPLPPHWTGKNNAMAAGAKIAKGKWLLFTDADTVHKPGSLARAVREAEGHQADLLSYSPEQEARTFWEKAIMPVIFAELAATYPPKKVNDPAWPIAAANGQYLMISRAAYDAVGGHAKIACDLLEDVAMARLVKSSGHRIFFRYGGDAVRTRMYRNWPQMKEGWTKNLALLFTRPMERALLWLFVWMFAWITLLLGLLAIPSGHWKSAYLLLPVAFLYARIAAGKFPVPANLVAIAAGIPLAAYLLMCSALMKKKGGIAWKGRKYSATSA